MSNEPSPNDRTGVDNYEVLLTVHEVAAFLRIPVATLYGWRHRREGPPALRVGRHLRYRAVDVHRWLDTRVSEVAPRR